MSSAKETLVGVAAKWFRQPRTSGETLAYLTECQLATLEHYLLRKGQIGERRRHIDISALFVDAAKRYTTAEERAAVKAGRLIEILDEEAPK